MKSNTKAKGSGGKRGVRLNKPQDVRRLLSRLVNQAIAGEISTDLLRGCTYACHAILKSLEIGELEDRLKEIELKVFFK